MRHITIAAVLAVLSLPQPIAAETFDVIRPGDSVMSCKALTAEINSLTRSVTKQRERAASRAAGRGGLRGLFGALAPVAIPVLSEVSAQNGGVVGSTAESAGYAIQNAANSPTSQAPAAAPTPSLEQQRLDRLTRLHAAKPC
jgi:hypothetical protein